MKRNLCFLLAATVSSAAFGHGYIVDSRSHQCKTGGNSSCGAIQYEPQSVEGNDRFPSTGPADGRIASGGRNWEPLDAQTPTRWNKVNMKSGAHTFRWNYTAPHSTRDWRYFITKQNWDPTQPLTRASFDLTPFCSFSGNNQAAPNPSLHNCNIPQRSGYQVILGVWDVADTSSSFYSVVDAQFDGSNPPPEPPTPPALKDVGDINPSQALRAGAKITLRLFTVQGELTSRSVEMTINQDSQGAANTWPKLFAEHINAQKSELKAGIKNQQGVVVPAVGKNDVFVPQNSNITRTEVSVKNDDGGITPTLNVVLNQDKFIVGSAMNITANVTTNQRMDVTAQLFHQGVSIAIKEQAGVLGDTVLNISVAEPKAGEYQLITTAKKVGSDSMLQKTVTVTVSEKPDSGTPKNVYPAGKGSYKVGDLIKGTDGNTYSCLVGNWCNGSSQYYAPGTGLAWQQAWKKVEDGNPPVGNPKVVYPAGKGSYTAGVLVKGYDGSTYRCKINNWCNGSSQYYAPGTGLAWQQAWDKVADGNGSQPPVTAKSVYPTGKGSYKAGDVIQGYDGNTYRCKIDNWCNGSSQYYAPGTGLAWQQAWTQI